MWGANEIVQGESGLSVSDKLDAEFARIQTDETAVWNKFGTLVYTDPITVLDNTKDNLIVSPYTMWGVLTPEFNKITKIKEVTDHLTEMLFDGTHWIRSDVMFEYTGAYIELDVLDNGYFVTKAHLASLSDSILGQALWRDGSIPLDAEYSPVNEQDIATRKFVIDVSNLVYSYAETGSVEYPPSAQGDTTFSASISGKNITIYVNGVLWRSSKYSITGSGFTFNEQLNEGDEVTLVILGKKETV